MNKKRKKKKIAFQEVQIFQVKEYHTKEGYIEKIFQSSKKNNAHIAGCMLKVQTLLFPIFHFT